MADEGAAVCVSHNNHCGYNARNSLIQRDMEDGPKGDFEACLIDSDNILWGADLNGGVHRYDGNSWRLFTIGDGLASNRVGSVAQAPDGSVWAFTDEGLSRYDGESWTSFPYPDPEFKQYFAFYHSLAVDRSGTVWCGMNGVMLSFDGTFWKTHDKSSGLPDERVFVSTLAAGFDGRIYSSFMYYGQEGLTGGAAPLIKTVYVYDGVSWEAMDTPEVTGTGFTAIANSPDGDLMASNDKDIFRLADNRTWISTGTGRGLGARSFVFDSYGAMWATSQHGVSRFDGERWREYIVEDGLPGNYVKSLASGENGIVWASTEKGIARFEPDEFAVDMWENSVLSNDRILGKVSHLFATSDGTVLAIHHDTVYKYSGESWSSHGIPGGVVNDAVLSTDDVLWLATENGVSMFDGVSWKAYTTDDGLSGNWIESISVGQDGVVSVAVHNQNVCVFDGSSWHSFTESDGLAYDGNGVELIATGADGSLWAASKTGISRLDGARWESYGTVDGIDLMNASLRFLAVAPNGDVWFGTYKNGLYRFDGGSWTKYDLTLTENHATGKGVFAFDPEGNIWVGTSEGVSAIDGVTVTTYTSEDGLAPGTVNAIEFESGGEAWFATTKGISHFDSGSWETYTVHHGLMDRNIISLAISPVGGIWCGETGVVSRFTGQASVSVEKKKSVPGAVPVLENFPNPFNNTTMIRYEVPLDSVVRLVIRNSVGQKTRTLIDEPKSAGIHNAIWDSRDEAGNMVSSGIYIARLTAGKNIASTRMMLLK